MGNAHFHQDSLHGTTFLQIPRRKEPPFSQVVTGIRYTTKSGTLVTGEIEFTETGTKFPRVQFTLSCNGCLYEFLPDDFLQGMEACQFWHALVEVYRCARLQAIRLDGFFELICARFAASEDAA